jgi:hypothetical protein
VGDAVRRVTLAAAIVVACGGAGSTGLDDSGGGNDGSTLDVVSNDAPTQQDALPPNDAATFDPKSVGGLVLWLRGDLGVTNAVSGAISAWKDQSGNANDATETRDGLQPTLLASGIHALPSVHFASTASAQAFSGFQGNDLLIADSATMEWGAGDFVVEVVARYTNDPTSSTHDAFGAFYIAIYGPPNTATSGLGLYGNVWKEPNDLATSSAIEAYVWGQPPATSSGNGYNNDTAHVFAMQRVGTTLSVRVDGAQAGTQAIGSVDLGKPGGRLGGCENAQAQRLEGDIAEVIAVKGTIAGGDLASLEGYLKARYAIP